MAKAAINKEEGSFEIRDLLFYVRGHSKEECQQS